MSKPPKAQEFDTVGEADRLVEQLYSIAERDELESSPLLNALFEDATGLLLCFCRGRTDGQPRIAENLLKVVEHYPQGKNANDLITVIGEAASFGFSSSGQVRGPQQFTQRIS